MYCTTTTRTVVRYICRNTLHITISLNNDRNEVLWTQPTSISVDDGKVVNAITQSMHSVDNQLAIALRLLTRNS